MVFVLLESLSINEKKRTATLLREALQLTHQENKTKKEKQFEFHFGLFNLPPRVMFPSMKFSLSLKRFIEEDDNISINISLNLNIGLEKNYSRIAMKR